MSASAARQTFEMDGGSYTWGLTPNLSPSFEPLSHENNQFPNHSTPLSASRARETFEIEDSSWKRKVFEMEDTELFDSEVSPESPTYEPANKSKIILSTPCKLNFFTLPAELESTSLPSQCVSPDNVAEFNISDQTVESPINFATNRSSFGRIGRRLSRSTDAFDLYPRSSWRAVRNSQLLEEITDLGLPDPANRSPDPLPSSAPGVVSPLSSSTPGVVSPSPSGIPGVLGTTRVMRDRNQSKFVSHQEPSTLINTQTEESPGDLTQNPIKHLIGSMIVNHKLITRSDPTTPYLQDSACQSFLQLGLKALEDFFRDELPRNLEALRILTHFILALALTVHGHRLNHHRKSLLLDIENWSRVSQDMIERRSFVHAMETICERPGILANARFHQISSGKKHFITQGDSESHRSVNRGVPLALQEWAKQSPPRDVTGQEYDTSYIDLLRNGILIQSCFLFFDGKPNNTLRVKC